MRSTALSARSSGSDGGSGPSASPPAAPAAGAASAGSAPARCARAACQSRGQLLGRAPADAAPTPATAEQPETCVPPERRSRVCERNRRHGHGQAARRSSATCRASNPADPAHSRRHSGALATEAAAGLKHVPGLLLCLAGAPRRARPGRSRSALRHGAAHRGAGLVAGRRGRLSRLATLKRGGRRLDGARGRRPRRGWRGRVQVRRGRRGGGRVRDAGDERAWAHRRLQPPERERRDLRARGPAVLHWSAVLRWEPARARACGVTMGCGAPVGTRAQWGLWHAWPRSGTGACGPATRWFGLDSVVHRGAHSQVMDTGGAHSPVITKPPAAAGAGAPAPAAAARAP